MINGWLLNLAAVAFPWRLVLLQPNNQAHRSSSSFFASCFGVVALASSSSPRLTAMVCLMLRCDLCDLGLSAGLR